MAVSLVACARDGRDDRRDDDDRRSDAVSRTLSESKETTPDSTGSVPDSTGTVPSDGTSATVSADGTSAAISRDRAIELALDNAGLTADEVRDLEAELDRERSGIYWEVDFEAGGYEYSYDIDSATGEIVRVDREFD